MHGPAGAKFTVQCWPTANIN